MLIFYEKKNVELIFFCQLKLIIGKLRRKFDFVYKYRVANCDFFYQLWYGPNIYVINTAASKLSGSLQGWRKDTIFDSVRCGCRLRKTFTNNKI